MGRVATHSAPRMRAENFRLPPDESIRRVIAVGSEGYGEADVTELAANPILHMQRWGRIEGTDPSGGEPAEGRSMLLGDVSAEVRFNFQAFQVKTDADGQFAFPRVPTGKWKLVYLQPQMNDGRTVWSHQTLQDVEVRAGETTTVLIGASGYRILGRVVWADGQSLAATGRTTAMLHTPFPQPPDEVQNDPQAMQRWASSPGIQELAKSVRQFQCVITADGRLTVENVSAGEYELTVHANVGVMGSDGKLALPGLGKAQVTVPENPPSGTLDLGQILLRKAGIVRGGQPKIRRLSRKDAL